MIDTKDDFRTWGDYLINREFDDIPYYQIRDLLRRNDYEKMFKM